MDLLCLLMNSHTICLISYSYCFFVTTSSHNALSVPQFHSSFTVIRSRRSHSLNAYFDDLSEPFFQRTCKTGGLFSTKIHLALFFFGGGQIGHKWWGHFEAQDQADGHFVLEIGQCTRAFGQDKSGHLRLNADWGLSGHLGGALRRGRGVKDVWVASLSEKEQRTRGLFNTLRQPSEPSPTTSLETLWLQSPQTLRGCSLKNHLKWRFLMVVCAAVDFTENQQTFIRLCNQM